MTKARTNASASPAVGRNMVINGGMNISQRAVSATGIGANYGGYFTVDRWRIYAQSTAGRLTMTQTSDGPNGISANCIKLDCTTADASIAAGEILLLKQTFEGQNLQRIGSGVAGAKQITVSFYVKASAGFTFGCELDNHDNNRQCTKLFDTTTDWVRHEITFPADVDDGSSPMDDDNAQSLSLNFWLHAGTTNTGGTLNTAAFANTTTANRAAGIDSFFSNTANNFFLTGVQMEVGPVATELEQEDAGVTLAKCQRYYQKELSGQVYDSTGAGGYYYSDTNFLGEYFLKTTMRADPSIAHSGNFRIVSGNAGHALADPFIAVNRATQSVVEFTCTVGDNNLIGVAGHISNNNDADAFIEFIAEL